MMRCSIEQSQVRSIIERKSRLNLFNQAVNLLNDCVVHARESKFVMATKFCFCEPSIRYFNDFVKYAISDLSKSFNAIGDGAGIEIN